MQHQQLRFRDSVISYYSIGSGSRVVIGFHGYGEEGRLYHFFEKYIGEQCSLYCIDLPYHGQTVWQNGTRFSHKDLLEIITIITGEPATGPGDKYTLLGFSLGGRIALSIYQARPEWFEKIVLMAPDGLKVNFWYWLSTQTWLGNKLFAFSMKNPGWFFSFLRLLNKAGFVNSSIFKFVNHHLGTQEIRWMLYLRWTALGKLRPNLEKIKKSIREFRTETALIYGKHDRIILPVRGEKFRKGIEDYCRIILIDSGHQVLHEKHAGQIVPIVLNNT